VCKSRDEFLLLNSANLLVSGTIVVLLTKAISNSATVVDEILFSIWLKKKMITVVFDHVWSELSLSMQCLLGQ
jgi:hypothetical protein